MEKDRQEMPPRDSIATSAKAIGVSEKFLKQLIRQGKIPFYEVNRRDHRVDLEDVLEWARTTKCRAGTNPTIATPPTPPQATPAMKHVKLKRSK